MQIFKSSKTLICSLVLFVLVNLNHVTFCQQQAQQEQAQFTSELIVITHSFFDEII